MADVRSDESIDRPVPRGGVQVAARAAALLLVAPVALVALVSGCTSAPTAPPTSSVLGTVRVSTIRAADDNHLIGALPQARLWTTGGPAPVDWVLTEGEATSVDVPVGSYTLSAHAVYLSDTVECVPDPNGGPEQSCFQPTLGPSLTCDLPVTVSASTIVEATFHLLAEGRCRLGPGPPDDEDGSPPASP